MSQSAVRKTIGDLKDRGKLTGMDVANIANVSKATVSRWSAGSAAPHPKTQLVLSDLRYVVDRLGEFYTPEYEGGLRHDDPALGIEWPAPVRVISDKDRSWPLIQGANP